MLSLYEKNNIKIPETLPNFKKLYTDKIQAILAMSPTTEDESVSIINVLVCMMCNVCVNETGDPSPYKNTHINELQLFLN